MSGRYRIHLSTAHVHPYFSCPFLVGLPTGPYYEGNWLGWTLKRPAKWGILFFLKSRGPNSALLFFLIVYVQIHFSIFLDFFWSMILMWVLMWFFILIFYVILMQFSWDPFVNMSCMILMWFFSAMAYLHTVVTYVELFTIKTCEFIWAYMWASMILMAFLYWFLLALDHFSLVIGYNVMDHFHVQLQWPTS